MLPIMLEFLPVLLRLILTRAVIVIACTLHIQQQQQHKKRTGGTRGQLRRRKHHSMKWVYDQLGPQIFRRAYRMEYEVFCQLSELLAPHIVVLARKKDSNPNFLGNCPNGRIWPSVRLGCALRYFAGGSPYDLMLVLGIGRADVFRSIWIVVEAIHRCTQLQISFPTDHQQQHLLAQEFKLKSSAGFDCCVGALDGLLIWIQRPNEMEAAKCLCSVLKFFCGRKHKFGLNCQAICDARRRFLDMSILFPGSTSDILSFELSTIYRQLSNNLLAPGLCLFGDNAYINSPFMATPYSATTGGTKDSYNFYHSQLRINIECAFGLFVHRWGILRAPLPCNISIAKTTSLVIALAKLHNFCIDANDSVEQPDASDNASLAMAGAINLVAVGNSLLPTDLLGGGNHFEDYDQTDRRRRGQYQDPLPREKLHDKIAQMGLTRPIRARNTI